MADGAAWNIFCDFDGTIAREDVTDSLLEVFAPVQWREIEAEWREGRIGSRECLVRQVALLRCTPSKLDTLLESVAVDPHFADFVRFCRSRSVRLTVVSDGFDLAIRSILGRKGLGLLPIVSNHLEYLGAERWRLVFRNARERCSVQSGTCKCDAMRRRSRGGPALLIGDGASDFCAAASADFVFAKDALLDHCRRLGHPHAAFSNFREVRALLASLLEPPASGECAPLQLATREITVDG